MSATASSMSSSKAAFSPRTLKLALLALFALAAMVWFSSRALLSTEFLPHWYCFVGNARLLWTTVLADLVIGLSYVVISATLAWVVRRAGRELPYSGFFWAFGLFIVSCGVTHFFEIVTVWKPVYWLSAAAKIVTAAASLGTAVVLLIAADDIVELAHTARDAASWRGNERFRALIQAAPMPVLGTDLQNRISVWNAAAERVLGWQAIEMLGKKHQLLPSDKQQELDEFRARAASGGLIMNYETICLDRNGERVPVSLSAASVLNDRGKPDGLVVVLEDISARKRTELELQEKREQQQKLEAQIRQAQKMEVLGRLAGGVAHDFNNMLMVLGGCSELLDRALPKESAARTYLDQIQRTTEKAAAITKQLLAFSRKQVLEFRPVDLHEALTESEFMLPRLLGSDIELAFRHEAAWSWILGDPGQIEQVVANLAVNARDAMPEGGKLTISTRNEWHLPERVVEASPDVQQWVVLEVSDTGVGIDEKIRAQIFEPFFTTKTDGRGTGLGLATVYGIVKQGHGHIYIDSAPTRGARFEIYFPATENKPARASVPPSVDVPVESGEGATVLIADDQAALRQAVTELLRGAGYNVLEAESSHEALEMARKHKDKIDVLLTDIVMPGYRGPELARRVTEVHPEIQVIYMSGYAESFPETQLPPNSTFLQKPFRFATLLQQLKISRQKS